MREFEEVIVENTELLPTSVTCNKCGETQELTGDEYLREFIANEYQSLYCKFGYGSKFDMDNWSFDLCETCLVDIIRTFKHLPEGYDEEYANKVFEKK